MSLSPVVPGMIPLAVSSAIALLAYTVAALRREPRWVALALGVGWGAHALALGVHALGVGEPQPGTRFGFAPALSVTLWLVVAVYAVESRFVPMAGVARRLAVIAALAVALALAFPGELHPQAGSPWAPLHWVLGIASYGLFGVALLHAGMLQRAERQLRTHATGTAPLGLPLLGLEKLTFRFVAAGFLVLSATLVLGWWFSSPWRWDHKTVFSVLAWAMFAALLAGRRAFGWRGRMATRWLYAGAALLLLAYVGSRFVLEVLLHRGGAAGG